MPVTAHELDAILDHCRSLIDAADQLNDAARARAYRATVAKRKWEGPYRSEFNTRFDDEAVDLGDRVRRLRAEADAWARVWAETVNELNEQRRQAAVDEISDNRGFGEQFGDFWLGHDDSGQQVRAVTPVPVPTAENRFFPTGGLESF